MVKVVQQLTPYTVMLDVGGAILTVHSMRPDETELMFGGIVPGVTMASSLGEPKSFDGKVFYLRYTSTPEFTAMKEEQNAP